MKGTKRKVWLLVIVFLSATSVFAVKIKPDTPYWVHFKDGTRIKCNLIAIPGKGYQVQDPGRLNGMIIPLEDIEELRIAPEAIEANSFRDIYDPVLSAGVGISAPVADLQDVLQSSWSVRAGASILLPMFSPILPRVGLLGYYISYQGNSSAGIDAKVQQVPLLAEVTLGRNGIMKAGSMLFDAYARAAGGLTFSSTSRTFVDDSTEKTSSVDGTMLAALGLQMRLGQLPVALSLETTYRAVFQDLTGQFVGVEVIMSYYFRK